MRWRLVCLVAAGCGRIGFDSPLALGEAGAVNDGPLISDPDAGIGIPPDAPDAAVGTGMPPANDDCNRAQAVVIGQATPGTTCDSTEYIQSGCAPFAIGDVFYEVMGIAGASYSVTVSSNAKLQPMLTCSMTGGPCQQAHTLNCAATGACRQIYLVETMQACEVFTITATQL